MCLRSVYSTITNNSNLKNPQTFIDAPSEQTFESLNDAYFHKKVKKSDKYKT